MYPEVTKSSSTRKLDQVANFSVSFLEEGRAVYSSLFPGDKQDVLINVIHVCAQKMHVWTSKGAPGGSLGCQRQAQKAGLCKGQGPWRREVITVLIFGTLGRAHGKARLSELPWKMPGGVGNPV